MNRAQACWSTGFFAAALLGVGMAQWDGPVQAQLVGMVLLVAGAAAILPAGFRPARQRPDSLAGETPHWARPHPSTAMLVAATLGAMLLEGTGAEWSAIYMRDVFAAMPFTAGAAMATCAGAQALARWHADGFVQRLGPVRVARTLHLLLGSGAALVLLAPHPALALLGFAQVGVGSSAILPPAMSAAAPITDRPAAVSVAALAQTSFLALFLGSPLLGWVATRFGIRWSFGVALPLVLLGWWAAKSLPPRIKATASLAARRQPWPSRWCRSRSVDQNGTPSTVPSSLAHDHCCPGIDQRSRPA